MSEVLTRELFIFTCDNCGKEKRESFDPKKAESRRCGKCRQVKIDDRQMVIPTIPTTEENSENLGVLY